MRVPFTYQNVEVLAALVKLTGHDFGYDGAAWRHWLSTSSGPTPTRPPRPAALTGRRGAEKR